MKTGAGLRALHVASGVFLAYGVRPFLFREERAALIVRPDRLSFCQAGRGPLGVRVLEEQSEPRLPDRPLIESLRRLRQQIGPYAPPVVLGLDSTLLAFHALTLPDPPPADVAAYVVGQAPGFLPPGLPLSSIALDYRVVEAHGARIAHVVVARQEALAALFEQVGRAGFRSPGCYPSALAAAESSPAGDAPLLLFDHQTLTLVVRSHGTPTDLHEIAWGTGGGPIDAERLARRIRSAVPDADKAVALPADDPAAAKALAGALEASGMTVPVLPARSQAQALARRAVLPGCVPFSLAGAPRPAILARENERRLALRVAVGAGVFLSVLAVILFGAGYHYAAEQRRMASELTAASAAIGRIQRFQAMEKALMQEVATIRAIRSGRTGVAGLLESLGKAVPDRLWLQSLRLSRDPATGGYRAAVSGFTSKDEAVVAFLTHLEDAPQFTAAGALTTTRLTPETVARQTGVETSVTRFETTLLARE